MGVDVGGHKYDISIQKGIAYKTATISFDDADPVFPKIKDSLNGLDMFQTGDKVVVSGSNLNDGTHDILLGNTPGEITIDGTLVDEAAGALVTLTPPIHGFMTVPTDVEFRRRANDFAPVIGQPGMQLEYAEDIWRPWTMGDFRGGFGQEEWDDPTRFAYMAPGLRIHKNRVSLDTQFVDEVAGDQPWGGVDFKGDHYAKAGNTVRKRTTAVLTASNIAFAATTPGTITHGGNDLAKFVTGDKIIITGSVSNDGTYDVSTGGVAGTLRTTQATLLEAAGATVTITGSWSLAKDFTVPAMDLAVFGDALYACTWGQYYWYTTDGYGWTQVSAPTGVQYQRQILSYRKFLWIAQDWTLYFNETPKDANTWMEPIIIGGVDSVFAVQGLAVIGGVIAIGRTNGIYIYEGSGDLAEGPIIDFENQVWIENCKLFTVVDGFLYYNVGNRVKKTDLRGSEFDVTPKATVEIDPEYRGFGTPMSGQGRQGHLYVGFTGIVASGSTYPTVMEIPTFDIGGWRTVYNAPADATMYGVWFSDIADRLLVNDGTTRTQRHQPHSDIPYPDYVQTSYLVTSRFDAGDVWSKKIYNKLLAYARDLTATETIKVEYQKDYSGIWMEIATFVGGTENSTPFCPLSHVAVSARILQLKITLSRDAGDSTKKPTLLLPLVASYIVRPDPTHAQQVAVRLEDDIMTHDNYRIPAGTAVTLKNFLRECEAFEFPIEYTDDDKEVWHVIISNTNELRSHAFTDREGNRAQEDVMILGMREVQS